MSGEAFAATLAAARPSRDGIVSRVKVSGRAFYTARCEFIREPGDPFAGGFDRPARFDDLRV